MLLCEEQTDPSAHAPLTGERNLIAVSLGRNVTRLRKEAKLTKEKFALMANIGRPFLNRIENGTADPRLSVVVRLADALDVSPEELLRPAEAVETRTRRGGHARLG